MQLPLNLYKMFKYQDFQSYGNQIIPKLVHLQVVLHGLIILQYNPYCFLEELYQVCVGHLQMEGKSNEILRVIRNYQHLIILLMVRVHKSE